MITTTELRGAARWDPIAHQRPLDAQAAELARWAAFLCPDGDVPDERREELAAVLAEWAEHDAALLHHAWAYASQRARAGRLHRVVPALLWDAWQAAPEASTTADIDVRRPEPPSPVEARDDDGTRVLCPSGELDAVTSGRLYEAIKAAVAARDHVVVDLSSVEFLDSAGLSALLVARRYVQRHGGDLAIVRPSRAARRAIDITGLREVLGVTDHAGPASVPA